VNEWIDWNHAVSWPSVFSLIEHVVWFILSVLQEDMGFTGVRVNCCKIAEIAACTISCWDLNL
jgi:hypothetical protein